MRLWLWALMLVLAAPAIGAREICRVDPGMPRSCGVDVACSEPVAEPVSACCGSPRLGTHDPVPITLAACFTCACGESCCTENRCGCCEGLPPQTPSDPRLPSPRDPVVPDHVLTATADAPRPSIAPQHAPDRRTAWVMSSDRRRAITSVRLI